jgi:hypothetical protein
MIKEKAKNLYRNIEWIKFSNKIKKRDNFKCFKCGHSSEKVVLQVHHTVYYENRKPWEYFLSDCITLCKGCHAREHNLIEPSYGWILISISDLGDLSGICERKNCNTPIRYEHEAYHPKWGYKTVGSTCIEFLTEKDKFISRQYIKFYTKIAKALNKFNWEKGKTEKGRLFISTKYKKSIIRVYEDNLSYQLAFYLGKNEHDWKIPIQPLKKKIKNIDFIKELALINLMGIIARERDKKEELEVLQNIFKNIKNSL